MLLELPCNISDISSKGVYGPGKITKKTTKNKNPGKTVDVLLTTLAGWKPEGGAHCPSIGLRPTS